MKKLLFLLPVLAFAVAGCTGGKKANDGKSIDTAYTVEEMIEVMKDYEGGQISSEEFYVTGVFATGTTYNSKYSSWSGYTVGHEKESEKPFQLYSVGMDESITKNYKGNGCLDGATFVIKGKAQLYVKEGQAPVFEIAYFSNKESGETHTPVIVKVEGGKEYEEPGVKKTNVAGALAAAEALADNGVTEDKYEVTGVVVASEEYSEQYGNVTFTMGDKATDTSVLTVFRWKCSAEDAAKLVAGAKVVVRATLTKYVKGETKLLETKTIESVKIG